MNAEIDRQTYLQAVQLLDDRQRDGHTNGQMCGWLDRQSDGHTDG